MTKNQKLILDEALELARRIWNTNGASFGVCDPVEVIAQAIMEFATRTPPEASAPGGEVVAAWKAGRDAALAVFSQTFAWRSFNRSQNIDGTTYYMEQDGEREFMTMGEVRKLFAEHQRRIEALVAPTPDTSEADRTPEDAIEPSSGCVFADLGIPRPSEEEIETRRTPAQGEPIAWIDQLGVDKLRAGDTAICGPRVKGDLNIHGLYLSASTPAQDGADLQAYKDELLKIAEAVGEKDDPFAAWETIELLVAQSRYAPASAEQAKPDGEVERLRKALDIIARGAVGDYYSTAEEVVGMLLATAAAALDSQPEGRDQ